MLPYKYNDGGRAAAGYKATQVGDCVCRGIAIASGQSYAWVYARLNELAKQERPKRNGKVSSARDVVYRETKDKLCRELGAVWVPTMTIGSGCKVHLRAGELPAGRLLVKVSKHSVAVIDGVINDTYDPSRDGSRCVYGYWKFPDPEL